MVNSYAEQPPRRSELVPKYQYLFGYPLRVSQSRPSMVAIPAGFIRTSVSDLAVFWRCLMNGGRIVQVGKPLEVYENPADTFVARFLGSPGMNLVPSTVIRSGGGHAVNFGGADLVIPMPDITNEDVIFGIRPEDISEDGSEGTVAFEGVVDTVEPLGADTLLLFRVAGHDAVLTARVDRSFQADPGQSVTLHINTPGIRLFDSRTEAALMRTEPEDA